MSGGAVNLVVLNLVMQVPDLDEIGQVEIRGAAEWAAVQFAGADVAERVPLFASSNRVADISRMSVRDHSGIRKKLIEQEKGQNNKKDPLRT